jgi:hypothetical protein
LKKLFVDNKNVKMSSYDWISTGSNLPVPIIR